MLRDRFGRRENYAPCFPHGLSRIPRTRTPFCSSGQWLFDDTGALVKLAWTD